MFQFPVTRASSAATLMLLWKLPQEFSGYHMKYAGKYATLNANAATMIGAFQRREHSTSVKSSMAEHIAAKGQKPTDRIACGIPSNVKAAGTKADKAAKRKNMNNGANPSRGFMPPVLTEMKKTPRAPSQTIRSTQLKMPNPAIL